MPQEKYPPGVSKRVIRWKDAVSIGDWPALVNRERYDALGGFGLELYDPQPDSLC
jgi:hypothetical protein